MFLSRIAFVFIFGAFVSGCAAQERGAREESMAVSVRQLLDDPGKYLNKEVVVKGFTKVQFEDVNIYSNVNEEPDTDSCISLLLKNALFETYKKTFNNRVSLVRGRFTSPACPDGSICTWICNQKYGITVHEIY